MLYLPIAVLIAFSFNQQNRGGVWKGFTLENYPKAWANQSIYDAMVNSLTIAFVTTLIATVIGLLVAWQAQEAKAAGIMIGGVAGLALAVLLGWAVYRQSVHLDLARFFTVTGVLLIVVAAGVLTYGLHELAEAGRIPETAVAFDISSWYAEDSWYGSLLKGIFGFRAEMLVLEVVAWFAYVVPVTWLFLRGIGRGAPSGRSTVGVSG